MAEGEEEDPDDGRDGWVDPATGVVYYQEEDVFEDLLELDGQAYMVLEDPLPPMMDEAGSPPGVFGVYGSYMDHRRALKDARLSRGFCATGSSGGGPNPDNRVRVSLADLKARSRCHQCKQIGHWSKECPQRRKSPGFPKSTATPAMFFVSPNGQADQEDSPAMIPMSQMPTKDDQNLKHYHHAGLFEKSDADERQSEPQALPPGSNNDHLSDYSPSLGG